MRAGVRKVVRDWMTESDNTTHDICRALALVALVAGIGLSLYSVVVKGQDFSAQDYGAGIGLLFGGLGVALGLKREAPTGAPTDEGK